MVEDTRIGNIAVDSWKLTTKFPYQIHPMPAEDFRSPYREHWRRILENGIDHAFVLITDGDVAMSSVVTRVVDLDIPVTVLMYEAEALRPVVDTNHNM